MTNQETVTLKTFQDIILMKNECSFDSLNALLTKTVTYPELVGKSNLEIHQKIYKIPLCFLNEHYGHDAISLLQGNLGARIAFLQILRQILPRYLLL